MKVSDREDTPIDGRQVLRLNGIKCIVPRGMRVVEMNKITPIVLGRLTPAYTWGDKIRVNPDIFALVDGELLVEECIHGFQYRRMQVGFFPTYIWDIVLDVVRKKQRNGKSIHNANLMEEEAMSGAKVIFNTFMNRVAVDRAMGKVPELDIEAQIVKYYGWERWVKK